LKKPGDPGFFYLCLLNQDESRKFVKIRKLMKSFFLVTLLFALTSATFENPVEDIQFVCLKTHKASNTCHFNFKVDGANYRYVDNGCKYSKKTEQVIKKVQAGELSLAKDWKIACPEPKEPKQ
jgi:hypothetical protein